MLLDDFIFLFLKLENYFFSGFLEFSVFSIFVGFAHEVFSNSLLVVFSVPPAKRGTVSFCSVRWFFQKFL